MQSGWKAWHIYRKHHQTNVSVLEFGSKSKSFCSLAISTHHELLGKIDAQKIEEKNTCFLTLVYVCYLDKNARQHMQKLCGNTIHMVILLCLHNFFSGAWMNTRQVGGFWSSHSLSKLMVMFSIKLIFKIKHSLFVWVLINKRWAHWFQSDPSRPK